MIFQFAIKLLKELPNLRNQFSGYNSPFVLFSDEWYILANQTFPSLSEYVGSDLIENGVGQVQNFLSRFENESIKFPINLPNEKNITIATGILIHNIFKEKIVPVLNNIYNMNVTLVPIKNYFFGHSVTVTGLLTGKDIISQLSSESLGDEVWMSHRILNDDGLRTLDDMTLEDISHSLGCPLLISNESFLDLVEGLYNA